MTAHDTSPPDLDAIEARIAACARLCAWEEGDGCREVATQRCAGGNCGLRLCEAHAEEHSNEAAHDAYPLPVSAVPEARALLAEVRRLLTLRDDIADAFDGLVMKVWRAAGEEHEPPADVGALLARVAAARREGAEVMREVCFAVCEDEGNTHNLTGAIPSRERDAREDGRRIGASRCAAAIRALPLPEAPPDASTYRRGAGAMMEACAQAVTGDGADVLRRQRDEEQAAWEREHGGEP